MKKLTREQKRRKKIQKRRDYIKRRKQRLEKIKQTPKPWEPVKMKMFKVPNLFPQNLSRKKRIEIIRSVGTKSKKEFSEKYPKIEKWFKKYDAPYLLSFCALYFTSFPEGIDPEASGHLDFPHHFLEILQAFSLYQPRASNLQPLMQNAEKLKKEMREIGELMMWRLVDIPKNLKTDEDIHAYSLRMEMMAQTTAVRNWAYYYQIKRTVLDLAKKIDSDFKGLYGLGAFKFMQTIFKLTEERNELINKHLDKVRSFYRKRGSSYKQIIKAYNKAFPENEPILGEDVEKIWETASKRKENLLGMLIYHSDLKLESLYSFKLNHAVSLAGKGVSKKSLKLLLDKLSYKFGGLKDFPKEHIILDNPVHHKPFIKTDSNTYFSSIWGALSHFILEILEELLSENAKLKTKYFGKIKSTYLENKTEDIIRKGFPNAKVCRGSLWGKGFENDLIVLIDTFAIVIEEKSRLLSPTAKRGAPLDLPETLRGLIEEPSEQALRFIKFLKSQKKSA